MAIIDFLVYNTGIPDGVTGYYRVVRYGVCDSADLAGQAYEANDVAIQNTAGEVPEYYNDETYMYLPYYNPTTNLLTSVAVPDTPPYDPTTDPTVHRTQASSHDDTENALLKRYATGGSFGLGAVNGKAITDFTDSVTPVVGFYIADESTVVGGPPSEDTGGYFLVQVLRDTVLRAVYVVYRLDPDPEAELPFRSWIGHRSDPMSGAPAWIETTPVLHDNGQEYLWTTTGAAAGLWHNTEGAGAGTFTSILPTSASKYGSMKRSLYSNVVTTLNQVLGQRNTDTLFFRGAVASGMGGFYVNARFGFDIWTNGGRLFAGLHTATGVISNDPSALPNSCGFAVDAADNGLIYFQTSDNAGGLTRVSTGITIASSNGYEIEMHCAPGGASVDWKIKNLNSGTIASGTQTLTLPVTTTRNTLGVLASNAALTAVNAVRLGVSRIYAKTNL